MHVMIDLETLDTTSTSIVLSIGAVKFDEHVVLSDYFYKVLGMEEQKIRGRTWSTSTLSWWLKQDKATLKEALDNPNDVAETLRLFQEWLPEECEGIWGNGSDFDNAIMGHIFQQYKREWPYFLNRCYRTMKNLYPMVPRPSQNTKAHNALDDAIWQALHMRNILRTFSASMVPSWDELEKTLTDFELGLDQ